jgi:hypothetical protein
MKKLLIALALGAAAASATPAFADVGISIRIGEPGFYGQLDIGSHYGRPAIINSRPVIITRGYRYAAPVYVRVPAGHQRNWKKYCGRYDACGRPVYFVRDEWYRDVYAPRYRRDHGHDRYDHDRHDGRRDDRRDWHDGRNDRHDDRRDHDRRDRNGRNDRDRGDRGRG